MIVRRDELISGQYFVAIAGVAAMRHILLAPSDVMPRLEDARRVIAHLDEFPNNIRIPVVECDVIEGYDAWAPVYDSGPNAATERDSEVVRELLEPLPRGRALDAACGTGRQSLLLTELGYEVEGVDLNETMLAIARARVPDGHFVQGRLDAIPHEDASFDVAVCSLALTHIPELLPGLSELARVVKPGGYAVLSDIHPVAVHLGISAGIPRSRHHRRDRAGAQPPARGERVRHRLPRDRVGDLRVRRARDARVRVERPPCIPGAARRGARCVRGAAVPSRMEAAASQRLT